MVTNQTECSRLEQCSVIKFWGIRCANHMKFIEKCVMCSEKHVLVKKMFTNKLNISLPLWAWVENSVFGVKTHLLSSKEKFLGAAVRKKGHFDSLIGHERNQHNWFPWKSCNCRQLPNLYAKFTLFIEWPMYIQHLFTYF